MTGPTPTPRAVSEEELAAAMAVVKEAFDRWPNNSFEVWPGDTSLASVALAALISHGWGPIPVIYSETILDHVSTPEAATSLIGILQQNGIEVRE